MVIAIDSRDRYGARFRCMCDCGVEVLVSNTNLGRCTHSCGCLARDTTASKQVWEVEYRHEMTLLRHRKKRYEWTLTLDEFKRLVQGPCRYCGGLPSQPTAVGGQLRNGIDRVDNARGYVIDNCVSACGTCNKMKHTLAEQTFIEHIRRISRHLGS